MMMIGGGGSSCRRTDHGIGVTEANAPSLANLEEKDFGSETFDNLFKLYCLNLWVSNSQKILVLFKDVIPKF